MVYLIYLDCDDVGYFIHPTIILTTDYNFLTLKEEIFGPVLTAIVYPDENFEDVVRQSFRLFFLNIKINFIAFS